MFYFDQLFSSKYLAVGEIMCEEYGPAGQAPDDNIIRRTLFTCWIIKATDTHSEYVIVIDFRRQDCARANAHTACLVLR